MCCFSRPAHVSTTRIFARPLKEGRQALVYSMKLTAKEDLAMILPLPVEAEAGEDALAFVDLEKYPDFFDDMKKGFPEPKSRARTLSGAAKGPPTGGLKVVDVGSFEASFVPTLADFSRLDERFRLPERVWESLPAYKTYGFAVFKLKPGAKTIHPMAFTFPRAKPEELFFPTVHVHDGTVHPKADFDHTLYCQQNRTATLDLTRWRESSRPAKGFVKVEDAKGLVDGERHCYQRVLRGQLANADVVL